MDVLENILTESIFDMSWKKKFQVCDEYKPEDGKKCEDNDEKWWWLKDNCKKMCGLC